MNFELANKFSKAELQDFSGIVDLPLSEEEEEVIVDNKENVVESVVEVNLDDAYIHDDTEELFEEEAMEEAGVVCCSTCEEKFVDASSKNAFLSRDQEEHLHDLKSIVKLQEGGITLDYRCPDCRSCIKCKNPSDTDRIT